MASDANFDEEIAEVGALLKLSSDGNDDALWTSRYSEHIRTSQRRHNQNLQLCVSLAEQKFEIHRASHELYEIVFDRLVARARRLDPVGGDCLRALLAATRPRLEEAMAAARIAIAPASNGLPLQTSRVTSGEPPLGPDTTMKPQFFRTPSGSKKSSYAIAAVAASLGASVNKKPKPSAAIAGMPIPRLQTALPRAAVALQFAAPQSVVKPCIGGYAPKAIPGVALGSTRATVEAMKVLTAVQLRSTIAMLYESKREQNMRCRQQNEPFETLEQHFYVFLSRRHTSPAEIFEWSQKVLRSVDYYRDKDLNVEVFSKLFNNVLPESFLQVKNRLTSTLKSLLKDIVRSKNKNRNDRELGAIWRARVSNGVPFEECIAAVGHLYDAKHSEFIFEQIRRSVEVWAKSPKVEPGTANYQEIVQICVKFQLGLTEDFLYEFVQTFKRIDTDEDGILDHDGINCLFQAMSAPDLQSDDPAEIVTALYEAKDSCLESLRGMRRATFSECSEIFNRLIVVRRHLEDFRAASSLGNPARSPRGAANVVSTHSPLASPPVVSVLASFGAQTGQGSSGFGAACFGGLRSQASSDPDHHDDAAGSVGGSDQAWSLGGRSDGSDDIGAECSLDR